MGNITSKKYFTKKDIADMREYNVKFIIYKDRIYGADKLCNFDHPAGNSLIVNNIGKDITKHMEFHSKKALALMKDDFIGYIR